MNRLGLLGRVGPAPLRFTPALAQMPSRGMATEKQLKNRLKSVISIRKITKAMKMVAASKLRQVERLLKGARQFQGSISSVWPTFTTDKPIEKHLIVALTSDRGLCGAVNSAVVKQTKRLLVDAKSANIDAEVMIIGEKAKGGLERLYKSTFTHVFVEVGKSRPVTFAEVSLIAEHALSRKYDKVFFVYNKFKSAIAYDTVAVEDLSMELTSANTLQWEKFEFEGETSEVLNNLYEFRSAVNIFAMIVEGATSEQSARMAAMDNSTKNAGEMIEKLRLKYNRTRQAKITTELIEIISGAAAAEEQVSK